MRPFVVASIVEGHGEVSAVPVLLRRLNPGLKVARPIRVKRQKIVKEGELERYAKIAEANIVDGGGLGALLLVLDADDECAARLGPALQDRLRVALPHRAVACALAVREYESWLIAGMSQGSATIDETRGGKGWLAEVRGRYVETVDQPKLTASMDIQLARGRSRSFLHLVNAIGAFATNSDDAALGNI